MDGGDGRRLITCSGLAQDKTVVNKTMLRFRPIAPRPVTGSSILGQPPAGDKNPLAMFKRSKRKYVRVRKNNSGYKRKTRVSSADPKTDLEDCSGSHKNPVTLQLFPEKEDVFCSMNGDQDNNIDNRVADRMAENNRDSRVGLMSLIKSDDDLAGLRSSDSTVVDSWLTVERVTGTCTDVVPGNRTGCTDAELVSSLEADTRPGFVSDPWNQVRWSNASFLRFLRLGLGDQSLSQERIRMHLVVKEQNELVCMAALFRVVTCMVKFQYASTWQMDKKGWVAMTVPCDVWRMDLGGFAWRLDVEAALSLGQI